MTSVTVGVDFQHRADEENNLALLRDVIAGDVPVRGQRVVATDGEESLWAIVTAVEVKDGTMLLALRWDQPVSAA
jgi:hypothetical protein